MVNYLYITIFLTIAILLYFKLAHHFGIVDRPNHRSLHQQETIRGAGIIFPLSICLCGLAGQSVSVLLLAGLILISAISFIDDIKPLTTRIRLLVQFTAVAIMFYSLKITDIWSLYLVIIICPVVVGLINGFNFMDGINGITGLYNAVALLTLLYINHYTGSFTNDALLICPLLASTVFLFFNFRAKARCFAGDVGSISIAFWLIALLLTLISHSASYKYLFMFSIYGADVFFTLIKRLMLKQNITQPHKLHVYQQLVSNGGLSHRAVALCYAAAQILVNALLVFTHLPFVVYLVLVVAVLSAAYVFLNNRFSTASRAMQL